mmetsp:Transcript_48644/g.155395  ORF Transcript_48644/g.155395 Transcript_48644/m.155395 type:complete len:228 (-) Transcript_48644:442-1125(-)
MPTQWPQFAHHLPAVDALAVPGNDGDMLEAQPLVQPPRGSVVLPNVQRHKLRLGEAMLSHGLDMLEQLCPNALATVLWPHGEARHIQPRSEAVLAPRPLDTPGTVANDGGPGGRHSDEAAAWRLCREPDPVCAQLLPFAEATVVDLIQPGPVRRPVGPYHRGLPVYSTEVGWHARPELRSVPAACAHPALLLACVPHAESEAACSCVKGGHFHYACRGKPLHERAVQ